jgi:hypothetical protein
MMIDWRTWEIIKLNKMGKWMQNFFDRIEDITLYEKGKETK